MRKQPILPSPYRPSMRVWVEKPHSAPRRRAGRVKKKSGGRKKFKALLYSWVFAFCTFALIQASDDTLFSSLFLSLFGGDPGLNGVT
jgi:hypothetical protein